MKAMSVDSSERECERKSYLALEYVKLVLNGDQVEGDVEDSSQQERKEERGSGEVHCSAKISQLRPHKEAIF